MNWFRVDWKDQLLDKLHIIFKKLRYILTITKLRHL